MKRRPTLVEVRLPSLSGSSNAVQERGVEVQMARVTHTRSAMVVLSAGQFVTDAATAERVRMPEAITAEVLHKLPCGGLVFAYNGKQYIF